MFRALLRPSSGASQFCTYSLQSPCVVGLVVSSSFGLSLVTVKSLTPLLYPYSAIHVSGTLAPIIRSLPILHIQPPVTVCRWVGCIFQLWSVTSDSKIINTFIVSLFRYTCFGHSCAHHQEPPNSAHTASSHRVSLGWLYLPALVCHYCRSCDSSDRPKVEDTTNPTTHGDWRL